MPFEHQLPLQDRRAAGRLLAEELQFLRDEPDLLVLALPRGGVPVAFEVARALQAPLDVFVVRKIGLPGHPEYAAGAIASGGLKVMDVQPRDPFERMRLEAVIQQETLELARREQAYRGDRPPLIVQGRTVLLVDDGLATGATMTVAARAIRQQHPRRLIAAVPVASADAARRLEPCVDQMILGAVPEPFEAVSPWYHHFLQCTDQEVRDLLEASRQGWIAAMPS